MSDLVNHVKVLTNKARKFLYWVEQYEGQIDDDMKEFIIEVLDTHFNAVYIDYLLELLKGQRKINMTTLLRIARKLKIKNYRIMPRKQLINSIAILDPFLGAKLKGEYDAQGGNTSESGDIYRGASEKWFEGVSTEIPKESTNN